MVSLKDSKKYRKRFLASVTDLPVPLEAAGRGAGQGNGAPGYSGHAYLCVIQRTAYTWRNTHTVRAHRRPHSRSSSAAGSPAPVGDDSPADLHARDAHRPPRGQVRTPCAPPPPPPPPSMGRVSALHGTKDTRRGSLLDDGSTTLARNQTLPVLHRNAMVTDFH